MDDPWGSPWAEPISKPTLAPPETAKSLLSPPPRAFFGAASPSSSPWADDANGFGDWATSRAEQHDQGSASPNWGAWGDTSPTRSPTRPSAMTHLDPSGKASPVAWPSSALPSPLLSPLPRSRASSTTRQSVSDPWAAELSQNLAETDTAVANGLRNEQGNVPTNTASQPPQKDGFDHAQYSNDLPVKSGSENCSSATEGPPENPAIGSSPRSSFANSVDSHIEFERQDSPITPMDDEPRGRLHPTARREPGKVQELVGIYDGLTRVASEEPEHVVPLRKSNTEDCSNTEEPGLSVNISSPESDSDESSAEGSEKSKPRRKDSSASSVRSATPKATLTHHSEQSITSNTVENHESLPSFGHTDAVQDILTKFGPLNFQPEVKALESLFIDSPPQSAKPTGGPDPEDGIIRDSFSEISERKTWYRISRFGSMRKHDLGDDDNNYTRVSWPVTRLHDDTIVIVRRWMEEDSFVGKSILGGNKRSSVFNWDSSAAPVDLSTIYGKKASIEIARSPTTTTARRHASQSSVSSQTSAWGKRHSRQSSRTDAPIPAMPVDTAPSFGWSSSGPPKPSVSFAPPPAVPKPARSTAATSQPSETKLVAPTQQTPLSEAPVTVESRPLNNNTGATISRDLEDEDDDWGDMVASPGIEHNTPVQASSPFTTPASKSTLVMAATKPSSLADAWSSNDFSSFEAPAKPMDGPSEDISLTIERPQSLQKVRSSAKAEKMRSVAPDFTPQTESTPMPGDAAKSTISASTTTSTPLSDEDLSIANTIINNLPDLAYMLR